MTTAKPRGSESEDEQRRERIERAKAAYRRTLRNQADQDVDADASGGYAARSSNDERLLAERPPHWQVKNDRTR